MNTETARNGAPARGAAADRRPAVPSGPETAGRPTPGTSPVPPTVAALQSRAVDDIEALLRMGGRNLETLWAISQLAVDCIYRCADGQAQAWNALCRSAFELVARPVGRSGAPAAPGRAPEASAMVEEVLGQLRRLSEIIARTNRDALDLVANRAEACLAEVQDAAGRTARVDAWPVAGARH